jgi:hypothetical protein
VIGIIGPLYRIPRRARIEADLRAFPLPKSGNAIRLDVGRPSPMHPPYADLAWNIPA